MVKVKRSRGLFALPVAMLLSLVPAVGGADQHVAEDFGFIPNHGEASVSKIDLLTGEQVARYWTAPREAENNIDVRTWRTSRIDVGEDGDAWVVNTGADYFRYNNNVPVQGSVARIQGNTEGLDETNVDHDVPLDFGEDEAVQVFPVGDVGDVPRVVALDGDVVWVGFWQEKGYFQKYIYDEENGTLTPEGDPLDHEVWDFAPYDAKLDASGTLWFTSRDRGTQGVFSLNTETGEYKRHSSFNPYSLIVDEIRQIVWVTDYSNGLYEFDMSDPGTVANPTWIRHTLQGAAQTRGLALDTAGTVWVTSSDTDEVMQWLPATNEKGNTYGTEYVRPVGVGLDASGKMWVVMRDDTVFRTPDNPNGGFIEQFDPLADDMPVDPLSEAQVGRLPYAYGNFAVPVELAACETAWAFDEADANENWDISGSNAWGWNIGPLGEGVYEFELWAAAGQNDLDKGTLVGTVHVTYLDGTLTVVIEMDDGFRLEDAHLWVGDTPLPETRRGYTAAPGQFGFSPEENDGSTFVVEGLEGDIYIALHADVCGFIEAFDGYGE